MTQKDLYFAYMLYIRYIYFFVYVLVTENGK